MKAVVIGIAANKKKADCGRAISFLSFQEGSNDKQRIISLLLAVMNYSYFLQTGSLLAADSASYQIRLLPVSLSKS